MILEKHLKTIKKEFSKKLFRFFFRFFSYFNFNSFSLTIDFHENEAGLDKLIFTRDLTENKNSYKKGMKKGIDLKFSGMTQYNKSIRNIKL